MVTTTRIPNKEFICNMQKTMVNKTKSIKVLDINMYKRWEFFVRFKVSKVREFLGTCNMAYYICYIFFGLLKIMETFFQG